MDDYYSSMENYSPDLVDMTGDKLGEERIQLFENVPNNTVISNEPHTVKDDDEPDYLVAKKIKVKRYILKK